MNLLKHVTLDWESLSLFLPVKLRELYIHRGEKYSSQLVEWPKEVVGGNDLWVGPC